MVAGVIYDPLRDEMFVAERGKGAWMNGRAIHVSKTRTLQESLTATGFPSQQAAREPEHPLLPGDHAAVAWGAAGGVGGAGSGVCGVRAAGRLLGVQPESVGHQRGYLLVEEAGGTVTHFDGSKFTLDSREVFATNGLVKAEMQHLFTEMFAGRGLEPIPTPAEFAARRKGKAKWLRSTLPQGRSLLLLAMEDGRAERLVGPLGICVESRRRRRGPARPGDRISGEVCDTVLRRLIVMVDPVEEGVPDNLLVERASPEQRAPWSQRSRG